MTTTRRSVLFVNDSPLFLRDIRRFADGSIKSGHVINGGWRYERKDCTAFAKDGNGAVVNKWDIVTVDEVSVPDDFVGDYNEAIYRAVNGRKK